MADESTGISRICEYVPARSFRSVASVPREPSWSATRSTVVGVDSGNCCQPESSGPAVALLLNHTACAVMYTCEY